jgi:hypothetical protein
MDKAESLHRAWIILGFGILFLFLQALQLWAGKAFVGFGWKKSPWALRKKEPVLFWGNIVPFLGLGVFCIGFALTRLL